MVSLHREVQKVLYHSPYWCCIGELDEFERLVTQYSRCRMSVWIWIRISDRARYGKSASFSWTTDGNNSRNAIPNASETHCWYNSLCSRTYQWVEQSHPIPSHHISSFPTTFELPVTVPGGFRSALMIQTLTVDANHNLTDHYCNRGLELKRTMRSPKQFDRHTISGWKVASNPRSYFTDT